MCTETYEGTLMRTVKLTGTEAEMANVEETDIVTGKEIEIETDIMIGIEGAIGIDIAIEIVIAIEVAIETETEKAIGIVIGTEVTKETGEEIGTESGTENEAKIGIEIEGGTGRAVQTKREETPTRIKSKTETKSTLR